jgi:AcrR family transcriptional regulator/AraC-like DNA-binding protein
MARPRRFDENIVLEEAKQLFWTSGYDETSIADVTKASGVANGSIYSAYGSKFGLFRSVFERYCASRVAVVREAMASEPLSTRRTVENFFATIIADCADQPDRRGCLMLNSLAELGIREPEVLAMCESTTEAMENAVAERLRAGVRAGQLEATDDECVTLASQVILVSQGLIQLSRLGAPESKLVSVAALSTKMLPWAAADAPANAAVRSAEQRIEHSVRLFRDLIRAAPVANLEAVPAGVELSHSLVRAVRDAASARLRTDPPQAAARSALAREVRAYIDRHLGDPALSPTSIAAAHHVSLRSLHLVFEREEDTVSRVIQKRRLAAARAELESSPDDSIADLSARWGFGSASHFARAFTQAFGMPPSEVRRRTTRVH